MGRTNFERRKHACFDCVTQAAKVFEDLGGSQGEVSFDVFEETPLGIDFLDNPPDVWPQVARIVFTFPLSREGEGLTGISASNEMNFRTPWSAVEGGNIVPQRSWIQGLVCHPRHEGACSEGFPLDVTNSLISGFCDMEAELQAANACAQRKSVD